MSDFRILATRFVCLVALSLPLQVLASDFIFDNGDFDEDLSGWDNPNSRPAMWDPADADGNMNSGSALIGNDLSPSNNATPTVLEQCVRINPNTEVIFGGEVLVGSDQPEGTRGDIILRAFAEADCSESIGSSIFLSGSVTDDWELLEQSVILGPAVKSVRVSLGVRKPGGVTELAEARFDRVFVFVDSFLEGFFVDPSMSGSWGNPSESGHGLLLHLLNDTQAYMCWFTFDLDGNRTWICSLGRVEADSLRFPNAFTVEGGNFPPLFDPELIAQVPWGSITITFESCDAGTMEWTTSEPGYQSGSMPLARLADLWGSPCKQ